jgi:hypothetical protein
MYSGDARSDVCKQVLVQSYGDRVKDAALTPQRKAAVICDNIIRDSKEYRDSANDQDKTFMRYTQVCKSGPLRKEQKVRCGLVSATADFKQETRTKSFKAAGLRMKDICNARHNLVNDVESDLGKSRETVAIKTAPIAKDIHIITQSIRTEGEFGGTDQTQSRKCATPQNYVQQIHHVQNDRYLPDMHYNNALAIAKAAKHGNVREAHNNVVSDTSTQVDIAAIRAAKSAKRENIGGFNSNVDQDSDYASAKSTHQYKASQKLITETKLLNANGEDFMVESDNTMMRKTGNHGDHMAIDNVVANGQFLDNMSKERRSAGLGSKYMHRQIDEDTREVIQFGK